LTLQPLDSGFLKELKDELKRLWIADRLATEKQNISTKLKTVWERMVEQNFVNYWGESWARVSL